MNGNADTHRPGSQHLEWAACGTRLSVVETHDLRLLVRGAEVPTCPACRRGVSVRIMDPRAKRIMMGDEAP